MSQMTWTLPCYIWPQNNQPVLKQSGDFECLILFSASLFMLNYWETQTTVQGENDGENQEAEG